MEEKIITQEMLDRIIKKNSAKYLKKLEEKEKEIEMYKNMLENVDKAEAKAQPTTENIEQPDIPLNDEQVIEKVEQLLSIPEEERTKEDLMSLKLLKEPYANALFKRDMEEAKLWAAKNYDGNFEEFLSNEEFLDFADGLGGTLPQLVKKYLKITSNQPKQPVAAKTPGSAKDTSGIVAKEYFSKEEVAKMSPEQIKKYMSVIEKSMPKW